MIKKNSLTILAIETSCDETAAAVLSLNKQNLPVFSPQDSSFSEKLFLSRNKSADKNTLYWPKIQTLSSVIKSQIKLHANMGGVVPEVAARAHLKYIRPVVTKALKDSKLKIEQLDYIAVTQGPGLIPSLLVGVEFAKMLSLSSGIPLLPINHMAGHLYSPFGGMSSKLSSPSNLKFLFPMICLIVSGGHTMIVVMENTKNYKVIGRTVDDAAGEAFDKVAKLLGLPYPGGPAVSKLATKSKTTNIVFPRPMLHSKDYNFSFSGLKTAVLYKTQDLKFKISATAPMSIGAMADRKDLKIKAEICKAFQDAAVDILAIKTLRAAKEYKAKSISISGGVSANNALQKRFEQDCKKNKLKLLLPGKGLSTDNAEMIGIAAAFALINGARQTSPTKVIADPNLEL